MAALTLSAALPAQDRGIAPVKVSGGQRVALVIGNSAYTDAPLQNPVNDARAMAVRLKELGFTVTKLEDATRADMADAVASFEESLGPDRAGLFYFAGHGIQVRGRNYLVPVDAKISSEARVRTEAIGLDLITGAMEYANSKVNFIVLDACRNNPFERTVRGGSRGLAAVDAARGTLVAYATAPGSVAEDGTGNNGVYTAALLKALEKPGLKAEEVFKTVRQQVVANTRDRQTPWESSSLTGDFVFNVATGAPPAATAVAQPAVVSARPQQILADRDALFWESVKDSNDAAMLKAYLRKFPNGTFAPLAKLKIDGLSAVPGPTPTPAPPSQVAALLAAADVDVQRLRLTSPRNDNAVQKYRQVLSLDPGNSAAESGLRAVVDKYVELAERAGAQGRSSKATNYLNRADSVVPGTAVVAAARSVLAAQTAPAPSPSKTTVASAQPVPAVPAPAPPRPHIFAYAHCSETGAIGTAAGPGSAASVVQAAISDCIGKGGIPNCCANATDTAALGNQSLAGTWSATAYCSMTGAYGVAYGQGNANAAVNVAVGFCVQNGGVPNCCRSGSASRAW